MSKEISVPLTAFWVLVLGKSKILLFFPSLNRTFVREYTFKENTT